MIEQYVRFLRDRYRVESFRRAIEEVVKPGDRVVEVGSGLGTYALFAARAGARKVYAIEREPVRDALSQMVIENGLLGRVEVIGGDAAKVTLRPRADVLITEDFDHLFLDSDVTGLVAESRRRLLRPAGRVIPRRVRVLFVPVECPRLARRVDPWRGRFGWGLAWAAVREMQLNHVHTARLGPSSLLAPACAFTELETTRARARSISRTMTFVVRRPGTVNALAGWFDAELSPSVRITNAPGSRSRVWRQALLMLPPAQVRPGSQIRVRLSLFRDRWGSAFWRWTGHIATGQERPVEFDRTSFRAECLEPELLRAIENQAAVRERTARARVTRGGRPRSKEEVLSRKANDQLLLYVPHEGRMHTLNQTAAVVWEMCDGRHTVAEIVAEVLARYDAPQAAVEADVRALLGSFKRRRLVTWGLPPRSR